MSKDPLHTVKSLIKFFDSKGVSNEGHRTTNSPNKTKEHKVIREIDECPAEIKGLIQSDRTNNINQICRMLKNHTPSMVNTILKDLCTFAHDLIRSNKYKLIYLSILFEGCGFFNIEMTINHFECTYKRASTWFNSIPALVRHIRNDVCNERSKSIQYVRLHAYNNADFEREEWNPTFSGVLLDKLPKYAKKHTS